MVEKYYWSQKQDNNFAGLYKKFEFSQFTKACNICSIDTEAGDVSVSQAFFEVTAWNTDPSVKPDDLKFFKNERKSGW